MMYLDLRIVVVQADMIGPVQQVVERLRLRRFSEAVAQSTAPVAREIPVSARDAGNVRANNHAVLGGRHTGVAVRDTVEFVTDQAARTIHLRKRRPGKVVALFLLERVPFRKRDHLSIAPRGLGLLQRFQNIEAVAHDLGDVSSLKFRSRRLDAAYRGMGRHGRDHHLCNRLGR